MWLSGAFLWLTSGIGKTIAYVAIVATLTVALFVGFEALVAPLARTLSADHIALIQAFTPSNLNQCVSVVIAARIARWVYDRNVNIADKLSS